ncbi:MAG: PAS domain S-box protein [Methylocystis sp.]
MASDSLTSGCIPLRELTRIFPFFFAWDDSDVIVDIGPSLQKYCSRAKIGARLDELFYAQRPLGLFSSELARRNPNALFLLEDRENGRILRGAPVFLENPRLTVMLANPWITDAEQLVEYGLTLKDFGVQDQTIDTLQLLQTHRIVTDDLKRLNRTLTDQRAKLREQEAKSRKLALVASRTDNAVIVTDAVGRIEWVNDAFTRITGWPPEDVLGKKPSEFLQGPETDPEMIRFMSEELNARRGFTTQVINYRRDGQKFWVSIEVQPLFDEAGEVTNFMAIERDITERKNSEAAIEEYRQHLEVLVEDRTRELQRNKFLLEAIIKTSPNGILLIDDEGRIKMTNAAADQMFGYAPSELFGHMLETLVPEGQREAHVRHRRHFLQNPATRRMDQKSALAGRRRDGSTFPVDVALASFTVSGEQFAQATIADVTERQQAESALRDLNATLERKVEERTLALAAASAAKSEFLANMSHEIRTPMNGMLGLAQLLELEPLSPDQLAMVSRLRHAGQSLLGIINYILDFSKIEAGQLRLDPQPFNLGQVLAQVASLLGVTAHSKGLALHVGEPPPLAGRLVGDALRLEQILMNLVGNAIKFTERGRVDLRVEVRSITTAQPRLRFEVQDTGIGITPQEMTTLFKPFTQADGAITRRFGGTGLGLSICKRLAELMDGEIGLESQPGVGSMFWFEAPFERCAASEGAAANPAEEISTPGLRLSGLRCLVVDDSRMNREVVQRMLSHEGAQAILVGDGQQALQYLRVPSQTFDAVLMDIQMPVMDGLAATRAIREQLGLVDLPVIALTAGVLTEQRRQALEAGANDFLAKPVDLGELVAALLRSVGSRFGAPDPLAPATLANSTERTVTIDREQALRLLGDDQELFVKLLQSFLKDFGEAAQEVRRSLDSGDRSNAAHLLHTLRGAAGYIGARELAAAATTLENSILGDGPDVASQMVAFETLHSAALAGARSHLAAGEEGRQKTC